MVDNYSAKIWFASLYQIGGKTFKKLLNHTEDFIYFYNHFREFNFLTKAQIAEIERTQNIKYLNLNMKKYNTDILTYIDKDYPAKLKNIDDPPKSLFIRGNFSDSKPAVAIIGSRDPTKYGLETAYQLSYKLSKYCTIISGLAKGIDAQAHIGALDARGYTIGIIGCGVDSIYPLVNHNIYSRMYSQGCIISEYSFNTKPYPWHFPQRNRIISALADLVIVVEAKEKSGTNITVNTALEQGKDIMAVPGRINDINSIGCNLLIKDGAFILSSYKDVLDILNIKEDIHTKLDNDNSRLIDFLSSPRSVYEISKYTNLDEGTIIRLLVTLESKNLIRQAYPGLFVSLSN